MPNQPEGSTTNPLQSQGFGGGVNSVNIGSSEYFSSRDKFRSGGSPRFRGGDLPLVYPVDLLNEAQSNRQSAAIRFAPYKRESSQLRVELRKDAVAFGDVGEDNRIIEGTGAEIGLPFGDDNVDSQETPDNNSGIARGAYGLGSNTAVGGGIIGQLAGGSNQSPTDEELGKFVERISSDVRLSRAGNQKLEEIYLYCPTGLQFGDSVAYTEASAGGFNAVVEAFSGNFQAAADKLKLLGVGKLSKFAGLIPGMEESDLANYFTARYGIVENPRLESLFQNVNRKSFAFEFMLAPRSEDEANVILNIIEAFRFHMLPELSISGQMLLAPHEFEVEILHKTEGGDFDLNRNIPQIGRAFLEDVTLNYTPNEKSAFFHDGVPCQININLKFSQAILLNRQLVLAGF
tara:strand:- start:3745 stop:4953 length:1209 start_codon:yes stop_codon:yes gene_type:complete